MSLCGLRRTYLLPSRVNKSAQASSKARVWLGVFCTNSEPHRDRAVGAPALACDRTRGGLATRRLPPEAQSGSTALDLRSSRARRRLLTSGTGSGRVAVAGRPAGRDRPPTPSPHASPLRASCGLRLWPCAHQDGREIGGVERKYLGEHVPNFSRVGCGKRTRCPIIPDLASFRIPFCMCMSC